MDEAAAAHVPVLAAQSVDALAIRPDGAYVDATFGAGGHSALILARLGAAGRLIAFDADPAAQARRCLEIVGPDRLLFSTDYPYQYRPGGAARRFLEAAPLDDAARKALAHGNWDRLTAA